MLDPLGHRQPVGQRFQMQLRQKLRGDEIAVGRRLAVDENGLVAEILGQQQPCLEVAGEDLRRGEALRPQPLLMATNAFTSSASRAMAL